jgi:hypothetical protein
MKEAFDIQAELAKLRAMASAPTAARPAPRARNRDLDSRLTDLADLPAPSRLDLKRKAGVEIPTKTLASTSDVKLHLSFIGPNGEERVENAVTLKLGGHRRLDRLNLRLDLEIKGKA